MSRRDDSLHTPHSSSKGSLDSTAKSQWRLDPRSQESAAVVSREECIRIQQAWIKDKMGKSQEIKEDPEEDPSMCSDQDDDDPNDT
ncbi:Uncharacterized protein TCM_044103 [Theobroma cacao]|uniref:Uncharacterized protein n=1 Tax=Theobroma cacao TaxID=3641 RepID=A0A061FRE4_THECC|nr:Uncharacterized protein TCM_044103 [Theobroma cacao]